MELGHKPGNRIPGQPDPAAGDAGKAQKELAAASDGTADVQNAFRADPSLLTIREAAAKLRISRWTLYGLIHRRQLKTIRIGARRLVPAAALQALIDHLAGEEAA